MMSGKTCLECGRIIPMGPAARCPEHEQVYQRGRSKRRTGYSTKAWRALRAIVVARGLCEDCGKPEANEVHHRFPVAAGHPLLCPPEQLLLLCHSCHFTRDAGRLDVGAGAQLEVRVGRTEAARQRANAAEAHRLAHQPPWGDDGPNVA